MSGMDDLVTWLTAQLDDDERVARAASPGPWMPNAEHDEVLAVDDITVAEGFSLSGNQLRATVDHIARHDPARVLAEVDTKRRIIELHPHIRFATLPSEWPDHWKVTVKVAFPGTDQPYIGCEVDDWNSDYEIPEPGWWCPTVRLLALPYADRPGYREEWRPSASS